MPEKQHGNDIIHNSKQTCQEISTKQFEIQIYPQNNILKKSKRKSCQNPNRQYGHFFLYQLDLINLVKGKTSFKKSKSSQNTYFFLNKNSLTFENTITVLTDLSDCQKLVLTILKTTFSNNKSNDLFYQDYKENQLF